MKKTIFISVICLLLGAAPLALAQSQFVPLAPIPGLTETVTTSSTVLADFLNNLYVFLIGLAAALAVIQIIWAGLDIAIFHKDAVSMITEDRGKIRDALFGLILVLSPALVFSIINPSILNLSLNMPPLDTDFGFTASEVGPSACTTVKSGAYLETASCPSKAEAEKYSCKNGGTLNIPACHTIATNTKAGARGSSTGCGYSNPFTISCGKSITVTYQILVSSLVPDVAAQFAQALLGGGNVTPADAPRESEFSSACSSAGGKMVKDVSAVTYYSASSCSNAKPVASFTAKCYRVTLTCEAN